MVFRHDKTGMSASIRIPWTENNKCAGYFAQTCRVHKGQGSCLNIWNQTYGTPGRGGGVRKTYKKKEKKIDHRSWSEKDVLLRRANI